MGGSVDQGRGQRITVDISIARQHIARQGSVFFGGDAVVGCDGGVVDGGDGDRHGGGRAGFGSVGGGVGEAVGTVVVGVGGVGEGAVVVEDQLAVGGSVDKARKQRIAIDVDVIGKDIARQ